MNYSCVGRDDTHVSCCGVFMFHCSPQRGNRAFLVVSLGKPAAHLVSGLVKQNVARL